MATRYRVTSLAQISRHAKLLALPSARSRTITSAATQPVQNDAYVPGAGTSNRSQRAAATREKIHAAKPFSEFLTDGFNRRHDYLRISLTERCNLRCLYCMPEEGIQLSPEKHLLSSAEVYYLSALFVDQGVTKIRLTGGEPTVRKDIVPLMQRIGSLRKNGLKELALTTNAISLHRKLDAMVEAGLTGVNISLDTLDPFQFQLLTRRQGFDAVMKSIRRVEEMNDMGAGIKLKINAVVMRGLNDHQILPFIEMTKDRNIEVRFIEYMPFGGNKWSENKMLPYSEMLDIIRAKFPTFQRLKDAHNDTSKTWQVPGFTGRVGFITSMTHNFCGSCNRLRITSDGNLKVCLHGNAEVSLRDLLRENNDGEPMDDAAFDAIRQIELDRFDLNGHEGWITKERQLLSVIGAAVKRKQAKHAGMGTLEHLENRPMILIDEPQVTTSSLPTRNHSARPLSILRPSLLSYDVRQKAIPFHLLSNNLPAYGHARSYSSVVGSHRQKDDLSAPTTESNTAKEGSPKEPKTSEDTGFGVSPAELNATEASMENIETNYGFQSLAGLFAPQLSSSGNAQSRRKDDQQNAVERKFGTSMLDQNVGQSTAESNVTEEPLPPSEQRDRNRLDFSGHAEATPWRSQGPRPYLRAPRVTRNSEDEGLLDLLPPSHRQTSLPRSRNNSAPKPNWRTALASDDHSGDFGASHQYHKSSAQSERAVSSNESPPTLTHVNQAGEARIVDVGEKPHTKRVAIAVANVVFSNPEVHSLLLDNSTRKGDVLGTARVAGIMAAKRTSDLVPLCHPIQLSKITLDLGLHAPRADAANYKSHGGVRIMAHAECVGPTGVEMEALTAAMVSATTVFDMCKAMDREMVIQGARVVYKSGGKSGLHVHKHWARARTPDFFSSRGLTPPPE